MRVLILFFLLLGVARAQLIVNGGFEAPALSGTLNVSGAFSLAGWSGWMPGDGGNGGLVVGTDNGLAPREGAQHFTLNGGNPSERGWMEQSFSTVSGASYVVSFSVGRAGGGQALGLLASVSSGGAGLASLSAEPPGSRGYADFGFTFVANGSSAVLRFEDVSGGNSISDLYLDGVSVAQVSAIPEPGTWGAIGGVCALVAAWWRRRRLRRRALGLYC